MVERALSALNLAPILDDAVDWRFKGFPPTSDVITVGRVGQQGWHALDGDLVLPLLILKDRALRHNIEVMASYCREHDVSLAPHGKTPLAPQIAQLQLEAGAWGISVANLHQARVFRACGVSRLLMANELLDPMAIMWVAGELARDSDFEFLCLVDSLAGVAILEESLEAVHAPRPLEVLVELGACGGRSGCRTMEDATAVAKAVLNAPHLHLAGVEGYEGAIGGRTIEERIAEVDRYLQGMVTLCDEWYRARFFERLDEIVVSVGGSLFFDRVIDMFAPVRQLPARIILRSGSYVTHDLDTYEQLSPLAGRGNPSRRLLPALELWGMVLSTPEPGLAIVGFGKRDAAYDLALPKPFAVRRAGTTHPISATVRLTALNDQHAFLQTGPGCEVSVGDMIGCHISHPCTSFDKWQLVPLVDEDYRVIGAIRTLF